MDELKKAYDALEVLKALGLPVSSEQLKGIEDMEREYVENTIIPTLQKTLKPMVKKLQNNFSLHVEINKETGLNIRMVKFYKEQDAPLPSMIRTPKETAGSGVRQGRNLIKVVFPDGQEICHNQVWKTLMEVVKYAGLQKVRKLGIYEMGDNLISNQLNKKTQYRVAQKEIEPGWYLQTLSSTDAKLRHIKQINDRLRLGLKVSLVAI